MDTHYLAQLRGNAGCTIERKDLLELAWKILNDFARLNPTKEWRSLYTGERLSQT
jgi:hypothetical protein